jgi:hypothetical protein
MDEKTIITARFTQDTENAEKGRVIKIKAVLRVLCAFAVK